MEYAKGSIGRVFTVRIDHGDDLILELIKLAELEHIESDVFMLLGALKEAKLVTGPKESITPPELVWSGFDDTHEILGIGDIFYIARPITVSKESCLRCHSSPAAAPKSQLATYGDKNGFGWKLNEVIGAKVISVPQSRVIELARNLKVLVLGLLVACLLATVALINVFMRKTVTNPIQKMARVAQQVSTGDMTPEFQQKSNDEIGILAASLNRLKISLQIAMNMLDEEKK